jgi:hypothetical protein
MSPEIKRGPLSPAEASEQQVQQIPDEVFVVFNSLIARDLYDGASTVFQDEVVKALTEQGLRSVDINKNHWLDVEESYRAVGWKVLYEKPGYNETGRSYFEFRAPKRKPKSRGECHNDFS